MKKKRKERKKTYTYNCQDFIKEIQYPNITKTFLKSMSIMESKKKISEKPT
jgi:hypothetical protein